MVTLLISKSNPGRAAARVGNSLTLNVIAAAEAWILMTLDTQLPPASSSKRELFCSLVNFMNNFNTLPYLCNFDVFNIMHTGEIDTCQLLTSEIELLYYRT